jgi:D-glycero-D-manno-heptose 1,7-bisphosphate phosphatase
MGRPRPTVFLDRDGTLNREQGFVTSPGELAVLPRAREAVAALAAAGLQVVVLTNQSGIARGLYDEKGLAAIHERLHEELGGLPAAYLHCPHHPDGTGPYGGECRCRKPADGLLRQACELLPVDLQDSFLVGDSARDLLPARGWPLRPVLVRSGKPWREELARLEQAGLPPAQVADDLAAAVEWIVRQRH